MVLQEVSQYFEERFRRQLPSDNCSSGSEGGSLKRGEGGRGGRLARRARSFKEDFLDILSQMRSPGGGGSPKPPRSPKPRTASSSDVPEERSPLADLDLHVKQVQLALKHFRDVVSKNKLEVLPGNGTIVLESIATIQSVLKTYVFIDQSTALTTATKEVYQSLMKLIMLCDDVLIGGEKVLNKDNVHKVLKQVDEAVLELVTKVRAKIADQKSLAEKSVFSTDNSVFGKFSVDPPLRNSLPDIPLTPRERQILEKSSRAQVAYSSESITDTPPPKPPLPITKVWIGDSPPPLPPKKKSGGSGVGPPSHSMERLSLRSDNSSLGSLDSILNTSSRGDEEIHGLMDEENSITLPDTSLLPHGGMSSVVNGSQTSSCCWDSSCSNTSDPTQLTESPDPTPSYNNSIGLGTIDRTSASSGFFSIQHSSSQSYNYSSSTSKSSTVCYNSTTEERKLHTTMSLEQRSSQMSIEQRSSQVSIEQRSSSSSSSQVCLEQRVSSPGETPPALPEKKRSRRERQPSQYDNVPSINSPTDNKPPPLPLKKKHIMAYMEMFGNCSQPNASDLLRHSVHTYSLLQAEWQQQQQQISLTSTHSCSFSHTLSISQGNQLEGSFEMDDMKSPPALPPKRSRVKSVVTPPPEPAPPASPPPPPSPQPIAASTPAPFKETTFNNKEPTPMIEGETIVTNGDVDCLYDLDVSRLLVLKRPDEEGPMIRGGQPVALIIHATKASKNDFLYQEAFLTTYRTFLSPQDLIEKLCARHQRFSGNIDPAKQRAARESFSLLVRVVSDLTVSDLEDTLLKTLMDFVYHLLESGDLTMAKVLRLIILDKYNNKQLYYSMNTLLSSQNIYTRQSCLIDFKSDHVAEQMTLLDSELFMKIEIPEVLIWAQEQNEERSPNLTRFTEHFNKMSYWARSRILEQNDAKDRERYVVKFIKIMKHLRKINNFNSYLALLSALDSAPIRRLEWQKHITEGLKEYCALIDSSSSFRAYRQALAETQPPCIPYIGLVLQDLTFVHIGNSDYLSENVINFSKRWQQFNIVENMKRFKKGTYNFKKNERIIAFFNNFDDCLCEEAMWQISESIKPRGSKKVNQ
ncbi:guanine nucleotide-releasing factor 2 isoform X2 [Halyomorpha halys]|uniref:guanine nucleotide-releasing factor 2 isoform X2 n=1 Tax=Halyomorpha halys TaxID=286706 RepID=UPI0006D50DF5|nr:guanine nucleotide-releasing factor 2 isoform X2 [Halyomorpha halys]